MGHRASETVPSGRSLFVCALLVALSAAAPVRAALNLEGMTGYWMVPNALVLPYNALEVAGNRHDNNRDAGANVLVGMGVLPHLEIVARFAMPIQGIGGDLCINPKLAYTFQSDSWHPTSVAVGVEDVWGGARLMHANYVVATQRLGWIEASVGYGDGESYSTVLKAKHRVKRLGGVFGGVQIDAPLPDSFPLQASLIHDHDATTQRTGLRLGWREGAMSSHVELVRDWSQRGWEYGGGVAWALPVARPASEPDSLRWMRLRVGPWLQSFLGTEVGRFDLQASLEATGIVEPHPALLGYARLRQRLWYSDNFTEGKAFAAYRQEPVFWLEGAGAGWSPSNNLDRGLWLQGGVADGSWQGGAGEGSWRIWSGGPVAGALVGWWYSPDWDGTRLVWNPWLDWESRDRSWLVRLDAGRYWNRDEGFRMRLGRRYGRLVPSMGVAYTDRTLQMDARLELELDGIGWRPSKAFSLEPVPVWGHGYMTTVAGRDGVGNPLRPALAKDPALPLRGRYETWP